MTCRRCNGTGIEPTHGGSCFDCFEMKCDRCGKMVPHSKLKESWDGDRGIMICVDWSCDKRRANA